jgi:hypothetical protein
MGLLACPDTWFVTAGSCFFPITEVAMLVTLVPAEAEGAGKATARGSGQLLRVEDKVKK